MAGAHPLEAGSVVGALVVLPIVLPPTVLGFYLLLLDGAGAGRQLTAALGSARCPSPSGLVVASVFYSLPFVVQPIQNAFAAIGERPLEVAATCAPVPGTVSLASPAAGPAWFHHRGVLGFCPYGGRIRRGADDRRQHSGKTRAVGADLRPREGLDYSQAHWLAAGLVAFCFGRAAGLYRLGGRARASTGPGNERKAWRVRAACRWRISPSMPTSRSLCRAAA